jgi:hypothetical protein
MAFAFGELHGLDVAPRVMRSVPRYIESDNHINPFGRFELDMETQTAFAI